MFDFLRGRLAKAAPDSLVLDVQGVGYRVFIPSSLYARLPDVGVDLQVATTFVLRENSQALYGFLDERERDFFDVLLGVSGVGPKMALAIVGHLGLEGLQTALAEENVTAVCKVPGVGKKTAQRLLLEMRDKVSARFGDYALSPGAEGAAAGQNQLMRDAMSALVNLGYNQLAARKALQQIMGQEVRPTELGQVITQALQFL
jgi:Holliday junction DNA helicase RuvA